MVKRNPKEGLAAVTLLGTKGTKPAETDRLPRLSCLLKCGPGDPTSLKESEMKGTNASLATGAPPAQVHDAECAACHAWKTEDRGRGA